MAFRIDAINRADVDLYKESMPLRSRFQTVAAATYSLNSTISQIGMPPGHILWNDALTLWADKNCSVYVEFVGITTGATPYSFYKQRFDLTANKTETIQINTWLPEGHAFKLSAAAAISEATAFFYNMTGFRLCNDLNYAARKVMLCIGDSITNTSGPPTYGGRFFHQILQDHLTDVDIVTRRVLKGESGYTSANADFMRFSGSLTINRADLITYMFGTNDASLSDYQPVFENIMRWKKRYFPRAAFIALGPPDRVAGGTAIADIRAYLASIINNETGIATLGDPEFTVDRIWYRDMSAVVPADTEHIPDGVHPNQESHIAMGDDIWAGIQEYNITI